MSRGALYACLNRLEHEGLVRWRPDAPAAERDGHARRCYYLTPSGAHALGAPREGRLILERGPEESSFRRRDLDAANADASPRQDA